MDDKFLSYSQSSKKRDFSNFDGTIQNLYTSDFGGLTPVFVKPVLASDRFKISLNSEVKVNTLAAPTYSNIKQNFYSFFVSCQSVWKHWNSFISNGSDFQNVYGSNITNQDLKSVWKIPSIQTNHLQQITKIAKGFSIPIIKLTFESYHTGLQQDIPVDYLRALPHSSTLTDLNKILIDDSITHFTYAFTGDFSTFKGDLTSAIPVDDSFINNLFWLNHVGWRYVMKICPYIHFVNAQISYSSSKYWITFDNIDFGLSIDDFPQLLRIIHSKDVFTNTTLSDGFNYQSSVVPQYVLFRNFCDETSSVIDINQSPFGFMSNVLDTYAAGNIVLNSTTIYRKYVNNSEYVDFVPDLDLFVGGYESSPYDVESAKYIKLSNFWSKELIIVKGAGGQSLDGEFVLIYVNDSVSLMLPIASATEYLALFESEDFYPVLAPHSLCNKEPNNPPFYGTVYNPIDNSISTDSPYIHASSPSAVYGAPGLNIQPRLYSCDFLFPFYVNESELINAAGIYYFAEYPLSSQEKYAFGLNFIPLLDSSAISNGMTTFTFMLYLCNSALKTLDYCNIPFEGFTVRDFVNYAGEFINALPFMSLSKIWDEFFRNRTVSSPEMNFCEVNGPSLWLFNNYTYVTTDGFHKPDSKYIDFDDNTYQNSWVIPFDVLPKNGVGTFNLNRLVQDYDIPVAIQGTNEFHYFNVTCFADEFALLTGFQLNHAVNHQVIRPYLTLFSDSETKYLDVLYGAIIDRFYLPNYYNGLLHYKYQNFNKDYFSSALLDAMSGANQEEIPDNVTELRSAEAKQSFWEQTAVARSFKRFAQKMFGTSPSHQENNRPLLLGQSHNRISIGEIIQTSGSAETPQGTRTGIAGGHSVSGICNKEFNEQGYLIILSSITIDSQYYQGLHRNLTPYEGFLDYPFANFYNIGNQSINMRELSYFSNPLYKNQHFPSILGDSLRYRDTLSLIPSRFSTIANNPVKVTQENYVFNYNPNYCIDTDVNFEDTFGYVPRFSEWKFNQDELHGDFRNSLMPWNTFRTLHTMPFLSHNFVNWELSGFNYDLNRLFAVTDDSDKFIVSLFVNVEMHRPIPYYTIPKSSVN